MQALMVLGTASHVGKSLLGAALCRILADDGYRVAPFKAQNMSLNSAATPDGREIGRAQALQAEAARVAPAVEMNPILLKPTSDAGSQIVLLGRVYGDAPAAEYHKRRVEELFPHVVAAYESLAAKHDIIVLEGAGSPAEINLKAHDIVNMRMAEVANARCLLVGDIDRGGVFASLLGTLELLEPHERARIVAFAINKFRGDPALLEPGVRDIEARLEVPCAGVVPWLHDVGLDDEDAVSLEERPRARSRRWNGDAHAARPLRIAVVALPYLSNATDFDALEAEPGADVAYAHEAAEIDHADVVVLPGTKQTLGARRWLRDRGFDTAIRAAASAGGFVLGICGGYQLLGEHIDDRFAVEGGGSEAGLGLLPVRTELAREKITELVGVRASLQTYFGEGRIDGSGYEIHMGRTQTNAAGRCVPLITLTRRSGESIPDGAASANGRVAGTYVHGLFASDALRHAFLREVRRARALEPPRILANVAASREARIDRLAAHVRASLDYRSLLA